MIKAENQFDANFVGSEVNAVHRFPKADYRQDVGRAMLTKKSFVMFNTLVGQEKWVNNVSRQILW